MADEHHHAYDRAPTEHRSYSPKQLGFYVVTVSTGRYRQKTDGVSFVDESGDVAEKVVKERGHRVVGRDLIGDDARLLKQALLKGLLTDGADVVFFTGGTGISPTDVTVETISPILEKKIDGFGELLRSLSYQKIGAPAMLTRAIAGVIDRRIVICAPGSPDAVQTALDLFIGELPHAVFIAKGI